ncbi:serine-rich adhesin for platelets-like [Macrobrachium rosenbergii]|uniref:serine-rich adhesin for platelets-like n=1 Tax=Macrobrachium rosenbergii TaxID=79674 RepID=UPI0034D7B481
MLTDNHGIRTTFRLLKTQGICHTPKFHQLQVDTQRLCCWLLMLLLLSLSMASGLAVGVTVVGVVAIVGLLGLLGRYLGVWTWAWAWIRATREEKVQLCRSERTTSGRSYLFDNDLDWIGLWPRTGSYKRFSNLDDLSLVQSVDDPTRLPDQPDLPPQPLRPAPAPPPRIGGWTDSGEGSPSPASSIGGLGSMVETPPEPSRPAPVLDRRDSNRSLTGRIQRRDSSKELLVASQQGSPKRGSTNPFRASWIPPDESSEVTITQETSIDMSATSTSYSSVGGHRSTYAPLSEGSKNIFDVERNVNGPIPESTPSVPQETMDLLSHESPTSSGRDRLEDAVTSSISTGSNQDLSGGRRHQTAGEKMFPSNTTFSGGGGGGDASGGRLYENTEEKRFKSEDIFDKSSSSSYLSAGQKIFGSRDESDDKDVSADRAVGDRSTAVSADLKVGEKKAVDDSSTSAGQNLMAVSKENTTIHAATNPYTYLNLNAQSTVTNNRYDTRNFNSTLYGDSNYETKNIFNTSKETVNEVFSNSISNERESSPLCAIKDDKPSKEDVKGTAGENIISEVNTTTSARLPSAKDSLVSTDLLGSYDIPDTPPNTATNAPASPQIPARLAEVEVGLRLLGVKPERSRDTSQDWWPTESTFSSTSSRSLFSDQSSSSAEEESKRVRGSLSGSVLARDKALSSVDEESAFTSESKLSDATSSETSVLGGGTTEQASTDSVESEEDASTRRVREYIASLSARLRQLPDESSLTSGSDFLSTPPTSATFPITPPNSARILGEGSTETPPNSASPYSPFNNPRTSTSTPPSSATYRHVFGSRRASADASPSPVSPGIFNLSINRRLSLDTPPNSADLITATPPNSASSQVMFGETPPSSAGFSSTPPSSAGLGGSFDTGLAGMPGQTLKRAVSCDSVSSDTSVTLGELEDTSGQVTGYLSIQLVYDR